MPVIIKMREIQGRSRGFAKTLQQPAVTISMFLQVEYKKDLENSKGHSINFCETPQFQNAAKVGKFASDVSDIFEQSWNENTLL